MAAKEGDYAKSVLDAKTYPNRYYQVYHIETMKNGIKHAHCRVLGKKPRDVTLLLSNLIPETNPATVSRLNQVYPVKEYLNALGIKSMYDK